MMKTTKYILGGMITAAMLFSGCMKQDIDELRRKQAENADRIAALEEWQTAVNTNLTSLQGLINALQNNDYVTGVTQFDTPAPGGYRITFSKSGEATIWNGAKGDTGDAGKSAVAPVIGVAEHPEGSGDYYWTIDGKFIEEAGRKMPVTGDKGEKGITPQLHINATTNFWEVSYDGGDSWTSLDVEATGEKGEKGEQGDAIFAKDGIDNSHEDYVLFTLADGTALTLPKYRAAAVTFAGVTDGVYDTEIEPNKTYELGYTITGDKAGDITIVKAESDEAGISVGVTKTTATAGTINISSGALVPSNTMVTVLISDGKGYLAMYGVNLQAAPAVMSEANSYMLEPGGTAILIPVSRANAVLDPAQNLGAVTTGLGGVTADNYTVELVWSDTAVGDGGVVQELAARKVGDEGYIYVKSGIPGNAVICVKTDGVIKWSWHIWVTDPITTGTDTSTGLTWMDRNLGAKAATPVKNGALDKEQWLKTTGLYYQWGRKDAFPSSNGEPTYEGALHCKNQVYYTPDYPNGTQNDFPLANYSELPDLVKNPLHFASAATNFYGSVKEADDNNSWGKRTDTKTIYDPCPPGWKVPKQKYTNRDYSLGNYNNSAGWSAPDEWRTSAYTGLIFDGVDGASALGLFFPAAGERTPNANSKTMDLGKTGHYWTSTADSGTLAQPCNAMYIYFYGNPENILIYSDNATYALSGKPVRCIKE